MCVTKIQGLHEYAKVIKHPNLLALQRSSRQDISGQDILLIHGKESRVFTTYFLMTTPLYCQQTWMFNHFSILMETLNVGDIHMHQLQNVPFINSVNTILVNPVADACFWLSTCKEGTKFRLGEDEEYWMPRLKNRYYLHHITNYLF